MREKVLDKIIASQKELVANLRKSLETYESTTDLDEHDTIDLDDQSHQADIQDMEMEIAQKLKMELNDLKHIQSLSNRTADSFKEGAVVETEQAIFFVGFAFAPVDFDTRKILGISMEAPAFHVNEGKKKGDFLVLGSKKQKIQGVF